MVIRVKSCRRCLPKSKVYCGALHTHFTLTLSLSLSLSLSLTLILILTLTLTLTLHQASQLHCALLRILIPDYDGVDGWDKWVKALRDPLLPLSWPRHLHMYLTVVVDLEESEAFDETYGDGDAAVREDITRSLAEGEWPELRPHLKLKLLAWLVERVQGSETVRAHLDRNAEASALLKRELQLQLDEEEELERQAPYPQPYPSPDLDPSLNPLPYP